MNKFLALTAGFVIAAGISQLTGVSASPDLRSSPPVVASSTEVLSSLARSSDETVSYSSPVDSTPRVLREFSIGEHNWLPGHRGVDVAASVDLGVLAAGSGRVIFAGVLNDRSLVSIEHPDGIRTTYEPVSPVVSVGDQVEGGQVIGTLDGGHCLFESCLHWGAKRGSDDYINPMSLLAGPIRLVE